MKNNMPLTNTRELMKKFDFRMAKSLGQNFLIDEDILKSIVLGSEVSKEDCVLEIGPGMGVLTQALCEKAGKVLAIEIDKKLMPILKVTLFGYDNVNVINDDVLRVDLKSVLRDNFGDVPAKVVANLPYYITTPIIMKLLEERLNLKSITVMVQKEVGDRLKASPGGKDYGAISAAVQYYSVPHKILDVPPASFIPPPEVDSVVMRLDIREKPPVEVKSEEMLFRVIKAAFGQRRKTLLNALTAGSFNKSKEEIKDILGKAGIDDGRRGETLSLQEFAAIADELRQQ